METAKMLLNINWGEALFVTQSWSNLIKTKAPLSQGWCPLRDLRLYSHDDRGVLSLERQVKAAQQQSGCECKAS